MVRFLFSIIYKKRMKSHQEVIRSENTTFRDVNINKVEKKGDSYIRSE